MKSLPVILAFLSLPAAVAAGGPPAAAAGTTLTFGAFGTVTLYRPPAPAGVPAPRAVALFVSGDGGWNQGVVDMARAIAAEGALVVGIDIRTYLARSQQGKAACVYSAADFEALGQYVQKKLDLPDFTPPFLVGYSSGATLVYAVLAQAPKGTFAGAVSLGFCPDLPLTKPLCRGDGLAFDPGPKGKGIVFRAREDLAAPWRVLQGETDQVCDPAATKAYVGKIPTARLWSLPKVGHGYSVPQNWMPAFKEAVRDVAGPAPAAAKAARAGGAAAAAAVTEGVGDLPLVDVAPTAAPRDALAVMLTGDGGWAGLDRDVAAALAARGVSVVGWNSLRYYWTARTPEGAAADLARLLRHYLAPRPDARVLLVGYSLGADVLPFLVSRLPAELRERVRLVVLIGPSTTVSFQFHLSNWIGGDPDDARPTLPEAQKLAGLPVLCLHGTDETDSLCAKLPPALAAVETLAGGHHFGGDFDGVAGRILAAAGLGGP